MADDEADYDPEKFSPKVLRALAGEWEPTHDDTTPPNIDGIRRCKVDLEDWNFQTVWDVAEKRQLTFDAALNWIIAYGAGWIYPKDKK